MGTIVIIRFKQKDVVVVNVESLATLSKIGITQWCKDHDIEFDKNNDQVLTYTYHLNVRTLNFVS